MYGVTVVRVPAVVAALLLPLRRRVDVRLHALVERNRQFHQLAVGWLLFFESQRQQKNIQKKNITIIIITNTALSLVVFIFRHKEKDKFL